MTPSIQSIQALHVRARTQVTALEAEMLEGANQYACESCQCKVDAIRQMVLRTLPPYLCLQLNRFVFDLEVCVSVMRLSFCLRIFFERVLVSVYACA
jgi:ubiquitin C-terminal hydrolase